jgi:hypothetical protein
MDLSLMKSPSGFFDEAVSQLGKESFRTYVRNLNALYLLKTRFLAEFILSIAEGLRNGYKGR